MYQTLCSCLIHLVVKSLITSLYVVNVAFIYRQVLLGLYIYSLSVLAE